jgi:hypothetical protein
MHKLHLQKHPELVGQAEQEDGTSIKSRNFWHHPLVIIFLLFLAVQVLGSIAALIFGRL